MESFSSAFGVIHKSSKSEYRDSYLEGINPRSKTEVKRGKGSATRRIGGPALGATGGALLGGSLVTATGNPKLINIARLGGAVAGGSAAHTRNVRSGDTVGTNRRSGKKAKGKIGNDGIAFYTYQ